MLIVTIAVNNRVIHRITARRLDVPAKDTNRYEMSDGKIIEHVYDAGAIELAKIMLENYKE